MFKAQWINPYTGYPKPPKTKKSNSKEVERNKSICFRSKIKWKKGNKQKKQVTKFAKCDTCKKAKTENKNAIKIKTIEIMYSM